MADEFHSDEDFALGVEDFPSERDYKLHCLRHSTSHIMASAVQQMFPEAKFGIGPPIKTGFYYDMQAAEAAHTGGHVEIERRMREIKEGREFKRETLGEHEGARILWLSRSAVQNRIDQRYTR